MSVIGNSFAIQQSFMFESGSSIKIIKVCLTFAFALRSTIVSVCDAHWWRDAD